MLQSNLGSINLVNCLWDCHLWRLRPFCEDCGFSCTEDPPAC